MKRCGRMGFRLLSAVLAVWLTGFVSLDFAQLRGQKRNGRSTLRGAQTPRTVDRARRPAISRRATDRVLVRFRADITAENAEAILLTYQFGKIRRIGGIGVYRAQLPPAVPLRQALAILRQTPDVEYAGPDHRTRLFAVPNDTYFQSYQYNLRNRGGVLDISPDIQPQMTAGADIKAVPAWDETQGDAATVIAILDTGIDMSHVELQNKVVSTGRDFINGDMDATDDNSHGTWVAGIAAAETNNGEGVAGVAWNSKLLPVKVMDADGAGYYDELIDGIIWAADNGATVINISAGGDADDPALKAACKYAYDKGAVIVAAAGNDTSYVFFPAAYDEYVLAVAATDYNDERWVFSSYGPQVDVAAPGVWILGPVPQWFAGTGYLPYIFGSGTSAAAPHVAGLAALIKSAKPWLRVNQVMDIIRYTADDVNRTAYPGVDDYVGYGRINMERALVPVILSR